jgi:hypothetical protein
MPAHYSQELRDQVARTIGRFVGSGSRKAVQDRRQHRDPVSTASTG